MESTHSTTVLNASSLKLAVIGLGYVGLPLAVDQYW